MCEYVCACVRACNNLSSFKKSVNNSPVGSVASVANGFVVNFRLHSASSKQQKTITLC